MHGYVVLGYVVLGDGLLLKTFRSLIDIHPDPVQDRRLFSASLRARLNRDS